MLLASLLTLALLGGQEPACWTDDSGVPFEDILGSYTPWDRVVELTEFEAETEREWRIDTASEEGMGKFVYDNGSSCTVYPTDAE